MQETKQAYLKSRGEGKPLFFMDLPIVEKYLQADPFTRKVLDLYSTGKSPRDIVLILCGRSKNYILNDRLTSQIKYLIGKYEKIKQQKHLFDINGRKANKQPD